MEPLSRNRRIRVSSVPTWNLRQALSNVSRSKAVSRGGSVRFDEKLSGEGVFRGLKEAPRGKCLGLNRDQGTEE